MTLFAADEMDASIRHRHAQERRYGLLAVSGEFIIALAQGYGRRVIEITENALPDDAELVDIMPHSHKPGVYLVVYSHTFGPVPTGEMPPILPSPVFRRVEP